jgi:hypothetical protein
MRGKMVGRRCRVRRRKTAWDIAGACGGAGSFAGNPVGECTTVRTAFRAIRRALVALSMAAVLAGCAARERAEALYVYQNRLLAALISTIDTIETDDPELADRLYDSEDELNRVCGALQRASSRRMEGREIDGDFKWQVFASLNACAEKAREVEALLREVDPETAEQVLLGFGQENNPS